MDVTLRAPLPPGAAHRWGPALGWGLAGFLVVSPFVQLAGLCLGVQSGGLARLVPFALPVAAAVVVLLRRWPLPVLAALLAAAVATALAAPADEHTTLLDDTTLTWAQLGPAVLALCYVAASRAYRTALCAAGLVLAVPAGYQVAQVLGGMPVAEVRAQAGVLLQAALSWLLGHAMWQRRRFTAASRAQAAEQAVVAERLRIARELHDVVAHHLGVIAIQAGMGSRVIDSRPAEAGAALRAVEQTSREALAGLRRTVGTLRAAETGPGAGPGTGAATAVPGAGRRGPVPGGGSEGLASLDRLLASTAAAGVVVDLRRSGRPRPLPPEIDLAAYRIVQEALTNVVRHARARRCRLLVDHGPEELAVEVTDDGRGSQGVGAAREPGFGLVGMRERVHLLHGSLTAGPRPEGGFRVAARLPLPAAHRLATAPAEAP